MKSRNPFGGEGQTNKETRIMISKQNPQLIRLCKNIFFPEIWSKLVYEVLKGMQSYMFFSLLFLRKVAENTLFYHKFRNIHQQKIS